MKVYRRILTLGARPRPPCSTAKPGLRAAKFQSTASRSWTLTAQPVDNPGLLSKTENTDHADE
jgi:hypothetical protein